MSVKKSQSVPTKESHILVIDDDDRLRQLLKRYLAENGYRVTIAQSAKDARAVMQGIVFDLLVLDVMMPEETGIQLTRYLRETSAVPILLLTAMGEVEDRITGLESGADDYLTKPFEPRELLLRISTILRRGQGNVPNINESAIKIGNFEFDPDRGELNQNGETVRLTISEVRLLGQLVARAGETISREELCHKIGADPEGRALDVSIMRLRRKIEVDASAPRYICTIWGEGYTLRLD